MAANSIVKLTLESNQYERGIKQAQKSWNDFMRGIGISVGKFTAVGASIATVTGALKVAKDAFNSSQGNIDAWGRAISSAETIYSGFLNALNNSDIGGFLSRIDEIVEAATNAYNAISDLERFNAFNKMNVARGNAGYQKALDEYKLNPTSENKAALTEANKKVIDELSQAQRETENTYKSELQKLAQKRLNSKELQEKFIEVVSKGSYIDFEVAGSSFKKGLNINPFEQFYNGNKVFNTSVTGFKGRIKDRFTGEWRDMDEIEEQEFLLARAIAETTKEEYDKVQSLGVKAVQLEEQIYRQDRMYNRMAGNNQKPTRPQGGGGRSGKSNVIDYASDSIEAQEILVRRLTDLWRKASGELRDGYLQQLNEAKNDLDYMTGKNIVAGRQSMALGASPVGVATENPFEKYKDSALSVISPLQQMENELENLIALQERFGGFSSEVWKAYQAEIESTQEKINNFKGKGNTEDTAKDTAQAWREAVSSISQAGSALQNLEDPGAKIAGIIGQAVAQIALGFAQATTAASGAGPFAWIAAITGGLATMVSTISAIHSSTGYSEGGIVKGNTFSNDAIWGRLNAGEIVLNKAQAGVIAANLQGDGIQNLRLEAVVSGTQLRFVLNNESQARGRGQYVTTNFKG